MKIILLQDVAKVGRKHEIKDVNDGFARNFLLGQGRALSATTENLAKIEQIKKNKNEQVSRTVSSAQQLVEILRQKPLVIKAKASKEGHLFASLREKEIVTEIKKQFNLDVPISLIKLAKPIKEIGENKIALSTEVSPRGARGLSSVEVNIKVEAI